MLGSYCDTSVAIIICSVDVCAHHLIAHGNSERDNVIQFDWNASSLSICFAMEMKQLLNVKCEQQKKKHKTHMHANTQF